MNARSSQLLCFCSLPRISVEACEIKRLQDVRIRGYTTRTIQNPTTAPSVGAASAKTDKPVFVKRLRGSARPPRPKQWHITAGVLLSRPPILLPKLHPFEEQIQRYQDMIERHQYTRFPINFFFKQGSIAEKRWRQQHPREPKKSGSGILRETDDDEDMPEWIVGGKSDEQVMKARANLREEVAFDKTKKEQDDLSDDEKKDLEQYAAEEDQFDEQKTELPEEINLDLHRLERHPDQTLYCLVKNSQEWHKKSGKPVRGWTLIQAEAPGVQGDKVEGLHMAASRAIERHLGPRVQTWVVGTNPAAYITYPHSELLKIGRQEFNATREFIMKAHIFAGAVRLGKKYASDFVWVTRDEMEDMIDEPTWKAISPLLADR